MQAARFFVCRHRESVRGLLPVLQMYQIVCNTAVLQHLYHCCPAAPGDVYNKSLMAWMCWLLLTLQG
jgi:hypothetical protein